LFVAVAAIAAWQFSGRRDAAVVEQATAASAPASSVAASPAPPTPAQQIIIETPDPSPPSSLGKDDTKSPLPTPSPTTPADTTARASTADRAASPDVGAASGARGRPPGKPVPRVGEDPPLAANNGIGTTRPPESPTAGAPNPSVNGDRHVAPTTPLASRDTEPCSGRRRRPTTGGQSIDDVCKGSFSCATSAWTALRGGVAARRRSVPTFSLESENAWVSEARQRHPAEAPGAQVDTRYCTATGLPGKLPGKRPGPGYTGALPLQPEYSCRRHPISRSRRTGRISRSGRAACRAP
jgi:hypothetical protein